MTTKLKLTKFKHILCGITNETTWAILSEVRSAHPDAGWGVEIVGDHEPGTEPFDVEFKIQIRSDVSTAAGAFFAACTKLGVEVP